MRASWLVTTIVVSAFVALTAGSASAGSWDLDLSFSDDGRVKYPDVVGDSGNGVSVLGLIGQQVYATGTKSDGKSDSVFVMRTLADGTLDASYGDGGITRTPSIHSRRDSPRTDASLSADGSVVAAYAKGFGVPGSPGKVTIWRWTAEGVLDPSFSGDGVRRLHVPSYDESLDTFKGTTMPGLSTSVGVAVDSQGRVVVAALGAGKDKGDIWIYRLTTGGELDSAFSGDGLKRVDLYRIDWVDCLATDSDDRVLIGSDNYTSTRASTYRGHVIRLSADGSFDPEFSGNGVVHIGIRQTDPLTMGVDTDGVVTVAMAGIKPGRDGAVRIRADGTIDPAYGDNGLVTVDDDLLLLDAQVVDGRVALLLYPTGVAVDYSVVTTISPSGRTVLRGRVNPYQAGFVNSVGLDGERVLVGGSLYNRGDGFLARYSLN